MPRIARRSLAAHLLAFYVSASLCGVGFHSALEMTLLHHDHGVDPGAGPMISGAHDRLLCQFQAQGQILIELPQRESRPFRAFHVACPPAPTRRRAVRSLPSTCTTVCRFHVVVIVRAVCRLGGLTLRIHGPFPPFEHCSSREQARDRCWYSPAPITAGT